MSTIPMRNTPPDHGIRVPYETHSAFIRALFDSAGMGVDEAELMGRILATADKRCVYSHGTQQALGYLPKLRDGEVNPCPDVTVVRESETVVVLDGDGGMGYGPSHRGMETAIEKALAHGLGAATTRNHYHFGAAGNYSRMALEHGCVGWALSTHRIALDPNNVIMSASGGSPMSLAFPTRSQPPLVLDMAAVFMGYKDELFQEFYALFAKSLGLAVALQALGGILAGIWRPEFQPPQAKWESNQGAFLLAMKIDHFMDLDEFERSLDDFVSKARAMRPFPGMPYAELPGGMEWRWERENDEKGVPLSDEHRAKLEEIAHTFNVEPPYGAFESTRF